MTCSESSGFFVRATQDYVKVTGTDFGLGTADFVLEAWFRVSTLPGPGGYQCIISTRTESNSIPANIFLGLTNDLPVFHQNSIDRITGSAITVNTWYHMAAVRSSGTTRLFINGVQTGSDYIDSNNYASPGMVTIGGESTAGLTGWIDEVRISTGTDRGWFSGFTPPVAPYTVDAATLLLMHMEGTDGSTTFIDEVGHTAVAVGAAHIVTDQFAALCTTDCALSATGTWTALFTGMAVQPTPPPVTGAGVIITNGPVWKTWWEDQKAWEDEQTLRVNTARESPEYKRLKRKLRMLEDSREWATRKGELEGRIKEVLRQIEALERG